MSIPLSNITCNINEIPSYDSLGLKEDMTVGILQRRNDTILAMQTCCAPNPVNLVENCALWCEIPNGTTVDEWQLCQKRARPGSAEGISTWNDPDESGAIVTVAAPRIRSSLAGAGLVMLLVGGWIVGR